MDEETTQPLVYKLTRATISVQMEGEDGKIEDFALVQMDGSQKARYLNATTKRMKADKRGRMTIVKDFRGMDGDLLNQCLVRVAADGTHSPIGAGLLDSWPSHVTDDLFDKARTLNRLDVDDEKNRKLLAGVGVADSDEEGEEDDDEGES